MYQYIQSNLSYAIKLLGLFNRIERLSRQDPHILLLVEAEVVAAAVNYCIGLVIRLKNIEFAPCPLSFFVLDHQPSLILQIEGRHPARSDLFLGYRLFHLMDVRIGAHRVNTSILADHSEVAIFQLMEGEDCALTLVKRKHGGASHHVPSTEEGCNVEVLLDVGVLAEGVAVENLPQKSTMLQLFTTCDFKVHFTKLQNIGLRA